MYTCRPIVKIPCALALALSLALTPQVVDTPLQTGRYALSSLVRPAPPDIIDVPCARGVKGQGDNGS